MAEMIINMAPKTPISFGRKSNEVLGQQMKPDFH